MIKEIKKIATSVQLGLQLAKMNSTDEIKKNLAAHKAAKLLSENSGFLLKIGQYLGSSPDAHEEIQALSSASLSDSLEFSIIEQILLSEYKIPLEKLFNHIEPIGHIASISQVHQATTTSEEKIALKIKLPEIDNQMRSWIKLLGYIPSAGPVKKWDIQFSDFKKEISTCLLNELDFPSEQKKIKQINLLCQNTTWINSPVPLDLYSTANILAMSWMDGVSFKEVQKQNEVKRRYHADNLIRFYIKSIFQWNFYQADPNPGNFLFEDDCLNIIDAGSFTKISKNDAANLSLLILQKNLDSQQILSILVALGFDASKLQKIQNHLIDLISILTEPFRSNEFNILNWDAKHRIDQLLGDNKWWFRSSGPASLFPLMRSFGLFTRLVASLNSNSNWNLLFQEVFASVKIEPISNFIKINIQTEISRFISINVKDEDDIELVSMQIPIHSETKFEEIIPEDILEKLKLEKIQKEKLNFDMQSRTDTPFTLFEYQSKSRKVIVRIVT
ncbi:MAG: AarF/UbiB family protein [Pseudobdellovibrio sp.]